MSVDLGPVPRLTRREEPFGVYLYTYWTPPDVTGSLVLDTGAPGRVLVLVATALGSDCANWGCEGTFAATMWSMPSLLTSCGTEREQRTGDA